MDTTWKQETERRYVVYLLRDPGTHKVRYVGRTRDAGSRRTNHFGRRKKQRTPVNVWTDRMVNRGTPPVFEIACRFATREEAIAVERTLIDLYATFYGPSLLNRLDNALFASGTRFVGYKVDTRRSLWGGSVAEHVDCIWRPLRLKKLRLA